MMGLFLLGFSLGGLVGMAIIAWLLVSKNSPVIVADPSWLESAERWEWLRQHEKEQRAGVSPK